MAPFHLPSSFKAFAKTNRQESGRPTSPDSFHSPSVAEWVPTTTSAGKAEASSSSSEPTSSNRSKPNKSSNSDSAAAVARLNTQAIRDFVLPPLDFAASNRQKRSLGRSEPELEHPGYELRRPSTAQSNRRPSEGAISKTHYKAGSASFSNDRTNSTLMSIVRHSPSEIERQKLAYDFVC